MNAMQLIQRAPIRPGHDPLLAVELPTPEIGADEVLLAVHACAVCHTELDQIEGRVATPLPRVLGHQAVGRVIACGERVATGLKGQRVGVGWIASACGACKWCARGEENLCPSFQATGREIDGGYAERMAVAAGFVHPIPDGLPDSAAAPLLCAGAIGLRSLRLSGHGPGRILGLTGFGASNHLVLTLARILAPDAPVLVWARDPNQRAQALELGAAWAGDTDAQPPEQPDAIIDTTPVWTPVLAALTHLAHGGRLVVNAIAKENVDRERLAGLDYPTQLWREKEIKSVANVCRRDIREVLALAAEHPQLRPEHTVVPLLEANNALQRIRHGGVCGAIVLDCSC
ncbi:MAG: alcohol dehydrogenase catalytic domain-containing protein [Wenzhouxiangellaceae bacterium]|nr:alcohol dehydrogenase catalytic domain-containing protein [Wenzhouxiangellaceae bacterium]